MSDAGKCVKVERSMQLGAIQPPDSTQIDSGWNPETAVNLSFDTALALRRGRVSNTAQT